MSILLSVGIAHRDASLAQLERVAVTPPARGGLQARALAAGCAEVMVLSTCSRTELHTVLDLPSYDDAAGRRACWTIADRLVAALLGHCTDPVGRVTVAVGDDAVRHLFRVAAGLDSRIVGEVEVQAQLRSAARAAEAVEGEAHRLRRVAAAAIAAAKATADEQPRLLRRGLLAERAVSRALADSAGGVVAVVVGAGTMGRQVAEALTEARFDTTMLSRTSSATVGGGPRVHPLEELPSRLTSADVLVVATSAGRQILSAALVQQVLEARPERPLTIVDLSLPRNVDPAVVRIVGVRLLDLDDLADRGCGIAPDPDTLAAAETATDVAAERYCAEIRSRRAGPVINALRHQVEDVCLEQIRRTAKGLALSDDVLVRMASAVAGAVAHAPTLLARQAAAVDDETTLGLLAAAFGLDAADGAGSGRVA